MIVDQHDDEIGLGLAEEVAKQDEYKKEKGSHDHMISIG